MELVLRSKPRDTSHMILGTSPVSSELDIPNETDIPMSPLPHHRHTYTSHVLGSPGVIPTLPSHGSNHRVAQNLSQTGTGPKHNWLSGLPPFTRPRQLPRVASHFGEYA